MTTENYSQNDLFYAALIKAIEEHNPGFLGSLKTYVRELNLYKDHNRLSLNDIELIELLRQFRSLKESS